MQRNNLKHSSKNQKCSIFSPSWMNLNESEVRETMDSAVHKGYMMARQKVATMMSSVIKSNSSSHSVEADITLIIDQLYESWVAKV